jgi:hypothetical protein
MEMKKQIVPVWGAYYNGNFGDDLMGHMIASRLEDVGYSPRIWTDSDAFFKEKKWEYTLDLEKFIENASCVVLGGGLLFSKSNFSSYWHGLDALITLCEEKEIPIIGISIGSQGCHANMSLAAQKLINSPIFIAASLRLECDVEWLRNRGKNVQYFPDIVLTAMQYEKKEKINNVLLCLSVRTWEKPLIDWVVCRLKKREITVSTVGQYADDFSAMKNFYHARDSKVPNNGPNSVMDAIRNADVVVASGLHVGVASLSSGAEFIAYQAAGKTTEFMKQCGRQNQALRSKTKLGRLILFFRLYKSICALRFHGVDNDILKIKNAAGKHYDFMIKAVEQSVNK